MSKWIIKCLKNSIAEKGNYCYSLPVETTKAVIKELDRLNNIIDELENIRKEAIRYIQNNQLYNFDYDKEELFEIVSDKVAKEYLLNILNKGGNNE